MHFRPGDEYPALQKIYFNLTSSKNGSGCKAECSKASKCGTQACQQLPHSKRFVDKIIRAGIQSHDFVVFIRANGKNNDRKAMLRLPDLSYHVNAVDVGQTQIEDYDIGRLYGEK